jgi:VanZ family protein
VNQPVSARPDHRSTAWPLSLVAMALVAYASFYPLRGWAWPLEGAFLWGLPKLAHETQDDLAANVLGYLPLGCIWCLAHLRSGRAPLVAALAALATCSGWSYVIELTQHFLPTRVPSFMDWMLNTLGAAWGVLAALTMHALGWVDLWHRWRVQWFGRQTGGGLALLLLWPLGLLTPLSWPLAEGRLFPHLHRLLGLATEGSVWQPHVWPLAPPQAWTRLQQWVDSNDLATDMEVMTTLLGAMLPLCVAAAVSAHRKFRVGMFTLVILAAFGFTSLSSALNFGLAHALAWMTLPSLSGLLLASLAAWGLLAIRPPHAAILGLFVALGLLLLVHLAPSDPYFAQTLQSWERGLFIKFHGLSNWFSQLWPFAAAAWLIGRCRAGSSHGHGG